MICKSQGVQPRTFGDDNLVNINHVVVFSDTVLAVRGEKSKWFIKNADDKYDEEGHDFKTLRNRKYIEPRA